MASFEYKALTPQGKSRRGVIDADSSREANVLLRQQSLTPLAISPTSALRNSRKQSRSTKLSITDLCVVTRQFATLIGSGMTVEESLQAISKQAQSQKLRSLIGDVKSQVIEGTPLSEALKSYPRTFASIYTASIRAGEQSGKLDSVSERLADYLERRHLVSQNISASLIYPIFLLLSCLGIVIALVAYVVPKVVTVFEQTGDELPLLTRGLINLSEVLSSSGWIFAIALVLLVFVFRAVNKLPQFKMRLHRIYLRMPALGNLIRASDSALMARTLSIMMGSGVPLLAGMAAAADVANNEVLKKDLKIASEEVAQGVQISKALDKNGNFPPLLIQMVASGENNGKLPEMLERVAFATESETQSRLTTFVSLFEPMMILIMGGVVLVIVMAILIPIFDLNKVLALMPSVGQWVV